MWPQKVSSGEEDDLPMEHQESQHPLHEERHIDAQNERAFGLGLPQ